MVALMLPRASVGAAAICPGGTALFCRHAMGLGELGGVGIPECPEEVEPAWSGSAWWASRFGMGMASCACGAGTGVGPPWLGAATCKACAAWFAWVAGAWFANGAWVQLQLGLPAGLLELPGLRKWRAGLELCFAWPVQLQPGAPALLELPGLAGELGKQPVWWLPVLPGLARKLGKQPAGLELPVQLEPGLLGLLEQPGLGRELRKQPAGLERWLAWPVQPGLPVWPEVDSLHHMPGSASDETSQFPRCRLAAGCGQVLGTRCPGSHSAV